MRKRARKRPVIDRQRGTENSGGKGRYLRWLCNPLVWRTLVGLGRLVLEAYRLLRH
jgi:hypothetical protein